MKQQTLPFAKPVTQKLNLSLNEKHVLIHIRHTTTVWVKDEAFALAVTRLTKKGLLDAKGNITPAGIEQVALMRKNP